jgi:hypothetical protein
MAIPKMTVLRPDYAGTFTHLQALTITDAATAEAAAIGIKDCKRALEAIRTHPRLSVLYRKMKDAFDEVSKFKRDLEKPWEQLEKRLRNDLAAWRTAEAKAALQQSATLTEAARAGALDAIASSVDEVTLDDGETFVFGDVPGEAVVQQLAALTITVGSAPVAEAGFRRYWCPTITNLAALAQAWLDHRVPADVFTLRADGTIDVLGVVTRYAGELGLQMDWPGVQVDFQDRPIVGGGQS